MYTEGERLATGNWELATGNGDRQRQRPTTNANGNGEKPHARRFKLFETRRQVLRRWPLPLPVASCQFPVAIAVPSCQLPISRNLK